jgi:hypothetical protein
LVALAGAVSTSVKADSSPLDGLVVSLPAGTVVGADPDPWLDQGWLLNLSAYCATFDIRIQQTIPYYVRKVHLIIALNDAAYNNLDYLYLFPALCLNMSIAKSSFQYGVPSPYGLMSWQDDVYPTWFNDTLVEGGLIQHNGLEEPYHNMTVYVGFTNSTGARMHFDAYGTKQCNPTEPEYVVGNPNCKDSTVAFFPPEKCQVMFLTDPVCSNFNITFQCSTYHNGTKGTFYYGTSGIASASCACGYAFDHWEATGNVQVSAMTANPTTVTVKCGGTLKAVCKPIQCEVTFLTDPVCNDFNITFQGTTYHCGNDDTFCYGTSGPALARRASGYLFDHWEVSGNVFVSNVTANPTNVTIKCGGTLKAVCKLIQCQVMFLTDPVCSNFSIAFKDSVYRNGTIRTFPNGTSGPASAICGIEYVFDHWEVSGNVFVSNVTANPMNVTVMCGGTLKAVFTHIPCKVTFLTDPVGSNFNITFLGVTYLNGTIGTFTFETSSLAFANCSSGYVFDHWLPTGEVLVPSISANPVNVTIRCGGTLKAVFRRTTCAGFTAQQHSPFVTFDASSFSADPDGYLISYIWDFGDGNITTAAEPYMAHEYEKPGTYNVTLTVIDNNGISSSASQSLTISILVADLNNDGVVNILDVAKVARAFGLKVGESGWDGTFDLNGDKTINIIDVAKVAKEFGKSAE